MALRAGGRREAKVEAPRARRAILKPNPFARPPPRGRARPTQAAAPRLAGGPPAATLAAQARPHRTIPQAAGTGSASPPPPLAAARRGPMQHRRSRSIDLSRGAVGSGAHGVQIWACFARRPRMVQLVSALLRRPHAPDRWSTVAPNDGRSRQPAVGVDGRSAHPAGSPQRSARAAAERRSGLEQRGGQRAPRIALAAAELQDVVSFYLGFRGSTY